MGFKHQPRLRRKWQNADRMIRTHLPDPLPPLLFLTDPERTPEPKHILPALPRGSGVVLRHYGASNRFESAVKLQSVCRQYRLNLLISGDPVLAKAVGASGVHWPEQHLSAAARWRGRFKLQTSSAHSRQALHRAYLAGMDAALLSTVFPSNSPSAGSPMGPRRLRLLSRSTSLPLYGLGGIGADQAAAISGFTGIAAIEGLHALAKA